jgi:hypothetical protein
MILNILSFEMLSFIHSLILSSAINIDWAPTMYQPDLALGTKKRNKKAISLSCEACNLVGEEAAN